MNSQVLPLRRYPLIDTHDPDEMGTVVQRLFGDHGMTLGRQSDGFHAQLSFRPLRSTTLFFGHYDARMEIAIPHFDPFVMGVQLKGTARHVADGVDQTSTIRTLPPAISSGSSLRLTIKPDTEHLALCFDPAALTRKLTALVDAPLNAQLRFDPTADRDAAQLNALRRLILRFLGELDSEGPHWTVSPLALDEIEQALMISYLCVNPNNYTRWLDSPPRSVAPWQVRVCEEFIEAHWREPVPIEVLALLTNTSARSLFLSFRESRGYSPMAFVKQVRLRHAQEMLRHPSDATSVTDVAYTCGFNNLGHFAVDYCRAFGERPSETLSRAKGHRPIAASRRAPGASE